MAADLGHMLCNSKLVAIQILEVLQPQCMHVDIVQSCTISNVAPFNFLQIDLTDYIFGTSVSWGRSLWHVIAGRFNFSPSHHVASTFYRYFMDDALCYVCWYVTIKSWMLDVRVQSAYDKYLSVQWWRVCVLLAYNSLQGIQSMWGRTSGRILYLHKTCFCIQVGSMIF